MHDKIFSLPISGLDVYPMGHGDVAKKKKDRLGRPGGDKQEVLLHLNLFSKVPQLPIGGENLYVGYVLHDRSISFISRPVNRSEYCTHWPYNSRHTDVKPFLSKPKMAYAEAPKNILLPCNNLICFSAAATLTRSPPPPATSTPLRAANT